MTRLVVTVEYTDTSRDAFAEVLAALEFYFGSDREAVVSVVEERCDGPDGGAGNCTA